MAKAANNRKTIIFLHPDLGIGGAERLVVDAAVGLQNRGNRVVIFTSHCDPKHCFDEARNGTLDVRVRGNTLIPPSILGRFSILCAILRQLHLILQVYATSELRSLGPDAYFVDQLSAGLPLLRLLDPSSRIFFYCHFPDLLLARGRARWWKRTYRLPFDALEQWSMAFADTIAVNSNFTRGVVASTWPSLAKRKELKTVYPCVATGEANENEQAGSTLDGGEGEGRPLWNGKRFLLSINRFERKKDVALAIRAFAGLALPQRRGVRLVLAGGYDPRVVENVAYHRELVALAASLGLSHRTAGTIVTALQTPDDVEVLFLLSVPGALKELLLRNAALLVYTPRNEHFGIVPLEAMLRGVPVLAADSGGPVETVRDGVTGWLRSPDRPELWTEVMDLVLNRLPEGELVRMSEAGVRRVREGFGETHMAERLDGIFDEMLASEAEQASSKLGVVLSIASALVGVFVAVFVALWYGLGKGNERVVWAEE
ncbi:hypothetical protein DL771_005646 [Monosporascus sp. 5C6A]|nr:hypothetical protein DL771_005646 [Monosporascus sp. 5C6A]